MNEHIFNISFYLLVQGFGSFQVFNFEFQYQFSYAKMQRDTAPLSIGFSYEQTNQIISYTHHIYYHILSYTIIYCHILSYTVIHYH